VIYESHWTFTYLFQRQRIAFHFCVQTVVPLCEQKTQAWVPTEQINTVVKLTFLP
jgi:hypothetical protein